MSPSTNNYFVNIHSKNIIHTSQDASSSPVYGKLYSMQQYVIKLVSDLRQVCGFLWVLWFPPPIKLTAMIYLKYC